MCGSGRVRGFKVLSKMSGVLFIKIVIAFLVEVDFLWS